MEIKDLKVIIATHVNTTGPSQNLTEFCLRHKVREVFLVGHPLFYQANQKGCGFESYRDGFLVNEHYLSNRKHLELLEYLRHTLLNIWWVLKTKDKWDIYIGSDDLNAFCGILLKALGKVKKTVYYTIDYVPIRFKNKLLNKFYHWVDIFCVKHCDVTWNLSPRMTEAREKYHGLDIKYLRKQVLVPEGVWLDRMTRLPTEQINQHHLVFVGHLAYRLGPQKVIEALPRIIKTIPDIKFIIIGKGPDQKKMKELARNLGVERHTDFRGFILDHKEVENIISQCAVGMATYSDEERSLSYYCDPSKTKIYMGCGLPVIMTDMFYNAMEIQDCGAGKIVRYDAGDIAEAVISLVGNTGNLKDCKEKAVEYVKDLDWNIIFSNRLKSIIRNL